MEEEKSGNEKKVMLAIDESECSRYALEWTLGNLKDNITNSNLVIFTAIPVANFGYVYASSLGAAPAELIASIQENQKKAASALLEEAKELCAKHGVVAETLAAVGEPKEQICEMAEKLNIELLVLGSHSRGVIQRAFLGSVSNYCIHHAKCPVLVVKKKAA